MPGPQIGGRPLAVLKAPDRGQGPRLVSAVIAPGRGMLAVQIRADVPGLGEVDLLTSPPLEALPRVLCGGPQDAYGNASFSLGGAILLPFANRIRGRPGPGDRLETETQGRAIRLLRNWSGKAPGAERYAMHGLILSAPFEVAQLRDDEVTAHFSAEDFGGCWPSHTEATVSYRLGEGGLTLTVDAANVGQEPTPMGIGWHPYFNLLGGDRSAARLTLPARARLEVDDYDSVLPTGRILRADGAYDFREGRVLGNLHLDDCFVDLIRDGEAFTIEIADRACRLRLATTCPAVQAVQVYAPPDKAFVVVEPQFNWPDPFAAMWGHAAGMVRLEPGEAVRYQVTLSIVAA